MSEINGFTIVGIVTLGVFVIIVIALFLGYPKPIDRSRYYGDVFISESTIKARWIETSSRRNITYCTVHETHFLQQEACCFGCYREALDAAQR